MRRFLTSTAVVVPAAAVVATQTRNCQTAIARVEMRTWKYWNELDGPTALKECQAKEEAARNPNPKNKKEAMDHLLQGPSYEGVNDMQRAVNDMLAITNEPMEHAMNMGYNYHNIYKGGTMCKTHAETTSSDTYRFLRMLPK
eukprot:PhM_4_TR14732/c0_g1_i1/m.66483